MRPRLPAQVPADADSIIRVYDAEGRLIATVDPRSRQRTPIRPETTPSTVPPARSATKARRPWRQWTKRREA